MAGPALPDNLREVAAQKCGQIALNCPGAIQPHGVLIAADKSSLCVRYASVNADKVAGISAQELLGRSLRDSVFPICQNKLSAWLGESAELLGNPFVLNATQPTGSRWDVLVHGLEDHIILEFEAKDAALDSEAFLNEMRQSFLRIDGDISESPLFETVVHEVRRLTGFDRVMVYRFDEHWNGEVIAAAASDGLETYLGHHFPESDLPAQARTLFMDAWLRAIPDVDYVPVLLLAHPAVEGLPPINLKRSCLRSAAPCHIKFLQNMAVKATLTVPLRLGGRLWGLIACHHREPRWLARPVRTGCELIGQLVSSRLGLRMQQEDLRRSRHIQTMRDAVLLHLCSGDDTSTDTSVRKSPHSDEAGAQRQAAAFERTAASGTSAAARVDDTWLLFGTTPDEAFLDSLAKWLSENHANQAFFETDRLPHHFPPAGDFSHLACGLLAIMAFDNPSFCVFWFRPERVQMVTWAGNPNAQLRFEADGSPVLEPRASFERWREQIRGRSLAWSQAEINAALSFRAEVLNLKLRKSYEMGLAHMADERGTSHEKQNLLASVSHDLKNPLLAMRLNVQMLAQTLVDVDNGPAAPYLRAVERLCERMEDLVHGVLDLSKMEANDFSMEIRREDASALVQEAVDLYLPLATDKSITLTKDFPSQSPSVHCDRVRILQVLSNFLGNAIKFTRPGGTVRIGLSCDDHEVVFCVADSGIGLSEKNWERVFTRFWQERQGEREGFGLGLSIAKGIVKAHHGRIWVKSKLGKGAEFFFSLPVSPP